MTKKKKIRNKIYLSKNEKITKESEKKEKARSTNILIKSDGNSKSKE